jgi:Outer membrane protein beta-barrel domain
MKSVKLVIILVASLAFVSQSHGQVQFAVGLKAGPNFSKLDFNSNAADTYKSRTGFHGGAFALIKVTKFGIQPEILFSKQGSKFTANTTNYEANFDYINVPIILKLYLAAGLNIQVGPQFGFLSTSELKNTATGVKDPKSAEALFSKKSDTSIAIGAGWDLPLGITLDARYNIGLSDVKLSPTSQTPIDIKNKVIQVSIGYKLFKLGK